MILQKPIPIYPEKEIDSKRLRTFYNGVGFEKGFYVYLELKGKPPSTDTIPQLVFMLSKNGWSDRNPWKHLRKQLLEMNILVIARHHYNWCRYDWNDPHVPIEWKHGLVRVLAGESVKAVLASYEIIL